MPSTVHCTTARRRSAGMSARKPVRPARRRRAGQSGQANRGQSARCARSAGKAAGAGSRLEMSIQERGRIRVRAGNRERLEPELAGNGQRAGTGSGGTGSESDERGRAGPARPGGAAGRACRISRSRAAAAARPRPGHRGRRRARRTRPRGRRLPPVRGGRSRARGGDADAGGRPWDLRAEATEVLGRGFAVDWATLGPGDGRCMRMASGP